jgi:hypothetical protein
MGDIIIIPNSLLKKWGHRVFKAIAQTSTAYTSFFNKNEIQTQGCVTLELDSPPLF